jgi:8-oxo-dGTP diphosphatase
VTIVVGERAAADAATVGVEGVLRIYWACIDGPTPPQPLDHVALRWLRADEMDSVDWLPGDLPAVAEIKQVLLSS